MTIDEFADITQARIPTAPEFKAFVRSQGWKVVRRDNGSAALRGPLGDPLIHSLAKMLACEPYRTNVLALYDMPDDDARPDVVTSDPNPRPTTTTPAASEWETCRSCRATVLASAMTAMLGLCETPSRCPYPRPEAAAPTPSRPPSGPSSPSGNAMPLLVSRPATAPPTSSLFDGSASRG